MLIQACCTETKDMEVERSSEQPVAEQEGNCSHIPQEEEELVQDPSAADEELRDPLHQTLPDG